MAGDRWSPPAQRRLRVGLHDAAASASGDRLAPSPAATVEDVRAGVNDPAVWLKDQESDGVWASVLFPSLTMTFYGMLDTELRRACMRAYSDYAVEFCSAAPGRLRAIGMLDIDDVALGVQELVRLKEVGIAGVTIPVEQPHFRRYDSPDYEPLWAAAADLDVLVHLHVATNRSASFTAQRRFTNFVNEPDYHVRNCLADMIMADVFERHPSLRVVSVENEGGWLPYFLDRLDWHYRYNARYLGHRFATVDLPSDFVRRNVFVSFSEDRVLVEQRHVVGVGQLLWANDFPHSESTFPRSVELAGARFARLPVDEQLAITQQNAARLYDVTVPEVAA